MPNDPMIIFRERMRSKRKERGITLKEIASRLGIKEATAQRYESGVIKVVPYESIVGIANILCVSPAYLMGWEEPPLDDMEFLADIAGDKDLMDHVKKVRALSTDKRNMLYSYTDFLMKG